MRFFATGPETSLLQYQMTFKVGNTNAKKISRTHKFHLRLSLGLRLGLGLGLDITFEPQDLERRGFLQRD